MRELWLQIISTSGARVYSLVTGLVVLALTAHWLGPAGRGEMAAALVWTNLFYICLFSSLNVVLMREATSTRDEQWTARASGTLLAAAGVVTAIGWLLAALLYFVRRDWFGEVTTAVLIVSFLALPFLIWEQYGNAILLSLGRLDAYNWAVVAGKTLAVIALIAMFMMKTGVAGAVAAIVAGQVVVAAGSLPVIRRAARRGLMFDGALLRRLLAGAARLHPSTVATFIYAYSGVLVINRYLGSAATGVFQLASQLVEVMLVVPYAANVVLYSRLSSSGVDGMWPYQRRVLLWLVAFMTVAAVLAALLAPVIIPIIGGREFAAAVPVFRWLLVGAVLATVSSVMTTQWVGRGMFFQLSMLNIVGLIVNLAANLTLTPRFGVRGAVAAALLAYGVTAAANGVMAIRCNAEWRRSTTAAETV